MNLLQDLPCRQSLGDVGCVHVSSIVARNTPTNPIVYETVLVPELYSQLCYVQKQILKAQLRFMLLKADVPRGRHASTRGTAVDRCICDVEALSRLGPDCSIVFERNRQFCPPSVCCT